MLEFGALAKNCQSVNFRQRKSKMDLTIGTEYEGRHPTSHTVPGPDFVVKSSFESADLCALQIHNTKYQQN